MSPATSDLLEKARRIGTETAGRYADDVDAKARFPHEAVDALKKDRMLGAGVSREFGGSGASIGAQAIACETLGQHCASTAMIYAMHLIQVACIARHRGGSAFFARYLVEVVEEQTLLASVTSEATVGGELRTSVAGVERRADRIAIVKNATTISYGANADALLLTARRTPDAPANDQVLVFLRKADYSLEMTGTWDTLGMRGTCSPGFRVVADASAEQVLDASFTAALARAREFVRQQARSKPGTVPPVALRLAEASNLLQLMRNNVRDVTHECEDLMNGEAGDDALSSIPFALKMNNLKISSSQLVVQIVQQALLICGIAGYKNDSSFALGRHLRDALSAALMVGNDRIYATNASMLLVLKND
jgi:acyl-CoA dehydrogenase